MHRIRRYNDGATWHMHELSSRVVAESGIAKDRYHLGKLILQSLKDAPDFVLQIDGGTGKSETCGSVLERSVKCANAMTALGLKRGDVIILMAPNHLDLCIPYYAALYLGVAIAPIDRLLKIKELQDMFVIDEPKFVFCQTEKAKDVRIALDNCKQFDAKVITFGGKSEEVANSIFFGDMLNKYGNGATVNKFRAADFDPEDTTAILVSTSGTTGLPKQTVSTQKHFAISGHYAWARYSDFPTPINMALIVSQFQWVTAMLVFNHAAILRFTKLHSSSDMDQQHCCHLINTYKPNYMIISPTFLTSLFNSGDRSNKCDFSCFNSIIVGGSAVSKNLVAEMNKLYPKVEVFSGYGLSEISMCALSWDGEEPTSAGKPSPLMQYRLVNQETQEDIVEPNKPGELWLKGPNLFKGYYKNPAATKEALTEDGWFKTGDLFYRDEHWNFFFVERIKLLLKYKSHHISPVEIQNVIRQHSGVLDVAVTGIPHPECGELPVACVVPRNGFKVTAEEIKTLVKESLSDSKQLRGGVIFLNEIPTLPSTKLNIKKLKEIVLQMERE